MSKKRKLPKKYFIVDDGHVCSVTSEFFDNLGSRMVALTVGLQCLSAIYHTLSEDAVEGDDAYVGNMKVTTGLERSLTELDRRFPRLLREIHDMNRRDSGQRVYVC
jgi:hypothetical protein